MVAQRDSKVMVMMGEGARQDSKNMKLIAIVGLIYLPGTFVSGIFGMNFFSFEDQNGHQTWNVSDKFYIYLAITLPLTLLTISIWVLAFHSEALRIRIETLVKRSGNSGRRAARRDEQIGI